jgi:DNA-binding response OmpR family regulator
VVFDAITESFLDTNWAPSQAQRLIGRTRTLDSHASRLRRKLREAGLPAVLVENVWGVGYRLAGELPLE